VFEKHKKQKQGNATTSARAAIRARFLNDRAANRRKGRGEGQFQDLLRIIEHKYPNDARRQTVEWMEEAAPFIPAAKGTYRTISQRRQEAFFGNIQVTISTMRKLRMPLANLSDMNRKRMVACVDYWWNEQDLEVGTINDRVSVIRRFMAMVGKPDTIPSDAVWRRVLQDNGIDLPKRDNVLKMEKGWVDLGIDPCSIINAIAKEEPVCGIWLELEWRFGFRLNEVVQVQPARSLKGEFILIERGTKGGKTRQVPFSSNPERAALQRAVFERAIKMAEKLPKGILTIRGRNLEQAKSRMEYLMRKYGATKDQLGITGHGLRHQFACDLFKDLTGLPAPVLKQLPDSAYLAKRELVHAALLEVARQMGHERVSISAAYVSSVPALGRSQLQQLRDWEAAFQGAEAVFYKAGAEIAFLTGPSADGLPPRGAEPIELRVRLRDDVTLSVAARREAEMSHAFSEVLRVPVKAWVVSGSDRPERSYEVFLFDPTRPLASGGTAAGQ
jgi:integrase